MNTSLSAKLVINTESVPPLMLYQSKTTLPFFTAKRKRSPKSFKPPSACPNTSRPGTLHYFPPNTPFVRDSQLPKKPSPFNFSLPLHSVQSPAEHYFSLIDDKRLFSRSFLCNRMPILGYNAHQLLPTTAPISPPSFFANICGICVLLKFRA